MTIDAMPARATPSSATGAFDTCGGVWRLTRELAHGLRVAGVASTSVVLGLLMYWIVPQAQDLFLEMSANRSNAVLFWMAFYAVLVIAWVVPVYISSRWILARYNLLAERSSEDDQVPVKPWVTRLVPKLLGTLCLVAILLGQWQAITHAPNTGHVCVESDRRDASCLSRTRSHVYDYTQEPASVQIGGAPLATIRAGIVAAAIAAGALALLLLSYLHALASAALSQPSRRYAIGLVWLGGGGLMAFWLTSWIASLLFKPLSLWKLAGASQAAILAVLGGLSLYFDTNPFVGRPDEEREKWEILRPRLLDYTYNEIGPAGISFMLLFVLMSPVLIGVLVMLMRRCSGIGARGLRVCSRLNLSVAVLLVIILATLAVLILKSLRAWITMDLADPYSILHMTILPGVSLAILVLPSRGWHCDRRYLG